MGSEQQRLETNQDISGDTCHSQISELEEKYTRPKINKFFYGIQKLEEIATILVVPKKVTHPHKKTYLQG